MRGLPNIESLDQITFDDRGLVPCVVQDWNTGEVLTVAYMNEEALARTRETGETWFWSRSRQELWHKGETSGNVQRVRELRWDCDNDAGPAGSTSARTASSRPGRRAIPASARASTTATRARPSTRRCRCSSGRSPSAATRRPPRAA